eukprot:scaffold1999_cov153-Amphora_coffeaeformis.AAC.9
MVQCRARIQDNERCIVHGTANHMSGILVRHPARHEKGTYKGQYDTQSVRHGVHDFLKYQVSFQVNR